MSLHTCVHVYLYMYMYMYLTLFYTHTDINFEKCGIPHQFVLQPLVK